jgi:hypothetical protein
MFWIKTDPESGGVKCGVVGVDLEGFSDAELSSYLLRDIAEAGLVLLPLEAAGREEWAAAARSALEAAFRALHAECFEGFVGVHYSDGDVLGREHHCVWNVGPEEVKRLRVAERAPCPYCSAELGVNA